MTTFDVNVPTSFTVRKDSDTGEFVVRYRNKYGTRLPDCDYFTNDKDDAYGTGRHAISPFIKPITREGEKMYDAKLDAIVYFE